MPRIFLGRDGLSSDEMVNYYYADGGKLICHCWGRDDVLDPATETLRLEAEAARLVREFLSLERAAAIRRTADSIRRKFGLIG